MHTFNTRSLRLVPVLLGGLLALAGTANADNPTISIPINSQTINENTVGPALSVIVNDAETAAGSLSLSFFSNNNTTLISNGNISLGGSGSNRTVSVTPTAHRNGSATITLRVTDGDGDTANASFTVTVTPVNVAPTISGAALASISDNAGSPIALFSGSLAVADNDHGQPAGVQPPSETLTVSLAIDADDQVLGQFNEFAPGPVGSVTIVSSGAFQLTVTGTPPDLTTFLRNQVTYTPNNNGVPVAAPLPVLNIAMVAADGGENGAAAATRNLTINYNSVNDPPSGSVSADGLTASEGTPLAPFGNFTASDIDQSERIKVNIAVTPAGGGTFPANSLPFTGTPAQVESFIRALQFTPGDSPVDFVVTLTDVHPDGSEGTPVSLPSTRLNVTEVNGNPQIAGITTTLIRTSEGTPTALFSNVSVVDPDGDALTVSITYSPLSNGTFPAPFTLVGNSYTYAAATGAAATNALRALRFTPSPNAGSAVFGFTLAITDGHGGAATDSRTRVEITVVDNSPVITTVPEPLPTTPIPISPTSPVKPFDGWMVMDDSPSVTVTISLDDPAKGTLANGSAAGPQFSPSGANYLFVGNPTDAQSALRGLLFQASSTYPFPPASPGGTTFTVVANDGATSPTSRTVSIVLLNVGRNHFVTKVDDVSLPPVWSAGATYAVGDQVIYMGNAHSRIAAGNEAPFTAAMWSDAAAAEGTLRLAVALAKANDTITFNLPQYPATIRLTEKLVVAANLNFRGPGADKLTISGDTDGNLNPDTRIFDIRATVTMDGIGLSHGLGDSGGAISVSGAGDLTMRQCAVSESTASLWGGGIDVDQGKLRLENCLLRGNRTDGVLGRGGAAVSLYTSKACEFINCTFARNAQGSSSGKGGGAIYAEAFSPPNGLVLTLTHCTFAENSDAANAGTSVLANGFGTAVKLRNCIVGDARGGNFMVDGSATIASMGGNVSDDQTRLTFIQGGVAQSVFVFDKPSDQTSINPQFGPLGMTVGAYASYPINPTSPAIGSGVMAPVATDSRGVLRRDGSPDSGSFEADSPRRLVLNEIRFAAPNPAFLEFYNPRDSQPVDLNGYELFIDGRSTPLLTFAGLGLIQPGFGLIVATTNAVNGDGTPVVVNAGLVLAERGLVEIRRPPAGGGGALVYAAYNGKFSSALDPAMDYNLAGASITLSPQFVGAAYVPHPLVPGGTGGTSSPGNNANGTRFGASNAGPQAFADAILVDEDVPASLDLLANDFDADGTDRIVIVDVTGSDSAGANDALATSTRGAVVAIQPANNGTPATPHRGLTVNYDPRGSTELRSLPVGQERIDTFTYTIVDFTTGTADAYAVAPGAPGKTLVSSPAHRLAGTDLRIRISGSGAYDGVKLAELIDLNPPNGDYDKDRFLIPGAFTVAASGTWETVETRPIPTETNRDSATVSVTVLGANDSPTPVNDAVASQENRVLRIMADSSLAGTQTVFDTDSNYPMPRSISGTSLLLLDTDPDTDDNGESLRVAGVVGGVTPVGGFTRAQGGGAVTVRSTAHGLSTGETILISGYGGHPSYNAVHSVTVLGPDRFNIPVPFVDSHATTGIWARFAPGAQLAATSQYGAQVTLEIRADHRETNIVYNPRPSRFLDGIPQGGSELDTFYYAARDSHGALGLAKVTVTVAGVNDAPVPGHDPGTLAALAPLLGNSLTGNPTNLGNALSLLDIAYQFPASDESPGRANVGLFDPSNPSAGAFAVDQFWFTDEQTPIIFNIDPATSGPNDLLGNDTDVDRGDVLTIGTPGMIYTSREGASVSVSADGKTLAYNPSGSTRLNALARGERLVDTFIVTVNDRFGAGVSSLVAVLVSGLNDTPTAVTDTTFTTPENQAVVIGPPGVLLNDIEPDQNASLPDNRKMLVPVTNQPSTMNGVFYSTLVEGASGAVGGFRQDPANLLQTIVTAPNHPLMPGEEVVLRGTGVPAYEGQFVIASVDALAGTFTVPLVFVNGSALAAGEWVAVRSSLIYDPRGSKSDTGLLVPNGLDGLAFGQTFLDTITYRIFDGSFIFAMDDRFKVAADTASADLDVLANDRNLTGITTAVNLVAVGPTSRGGVAQRMTVGGKTIIRYVPQPGFVGDEAFIYTVEDELGNRDTAQVTVRATVNTLNGNLQANDDAFTVALGQSPVLAVLANDNIIPAGAGSLVISAPPTGATKGTLQLVAGGVRYTPNPGASGLDQFTYEISGGGSARATATVSIEIVDLTDKLFTRDDAFSVLVNSSANALDILANDNILPGNGLALRVSFTGTAADLPAHGSLALNATGTGFTYTPTAGFIGVDRFRYAASDGFGSTGSALATVTVGSLVTNNDFFVLPTTANAVPLSVLANDLVLSTPSGMVSVIGVAATAAGTPSVSLNLGAVGSIALVGGEVRFTAAGALDEATFFYTIEDQPTGRRAVGQASVAVIADGVSANPDFFSLLRGSGPTDLHVLFNDVAVPVRSLSLVSIGSGLDAPDRGGFASIVNTPSGPRIRYQPASGFIGEESFTYIITDGLRSDSAKVLVRVGLGDLYANDDSYSVFYAVSGNTPRSFSLPVLFNDKVLPAGGEELVVTGVGIDETVEPNAPNMRGQVAISADGTALVYTPAEDATLMPGDIFLERFTYVISDGTDRRAEASVVVNVRVRDLARAMETRDDAFTVAANSLGNALDVLANDGVKPAPASGWTITGVTAPQLFPTDPDPADANDGGVASVSGGRILYSPRAGFVGLVSFTYSVSDGLGGTGSATVFLKVGDVRVSDDVYTVLSGSTGNVFDVRANDGILPEGFPTRPDGSPLPGFTLDTATPLVPDRGGSASVVGGKIVYQPLAGFVGTERFGYWVVDDSGNRYPGQVTVGVELLGSDRATGTARILVTGVNDLPVLEGTARFTVTDKQVSTPFGGVRVTDVDNQGQESLVFTVALSDPSRGTLFHPGGLFTRVGNTYVSSPMSPAAATAALRQLEFQPTPDGRVLPGTTESVTISLSINDGHATVADTSTVVTTQHPPQSKVLPVVTATGVDDSMTGAAFGSSVSVDRDTMAVGSVNRDALGVDSGAVYLYQRVTAAGVDRWQQTKVVLAADGTAGDRFGISVAIDGDTLVVGASGDTPGGLSLAGSAYVFQRNAGGAGNWGQVAKLVVEAGLRAAGDEFGIDVDIDGDTVIVGAPFATRGVGDSGMARIYERNRGGAGAWGLVQEITQLDPIFLDWFGVSVAVSGNSIIVGAFGANRQQNAANFDLGAAYIFDRTGPAATPWQQGKKLDRFADPRSTRDDYFGWAVDISGDSVIVGSHLYNTTPATVDSGAAFLYGRNTGGTGNWGQLLELRSATPASDERLGYSVSLDGALALVGSDNRHATTGAGFVQCYVRDLGTNNWRFTDTLRPPDPTARPRFGYSVAVDAFTVAVGAPADRVNAGNRVDAGAVYSAQLQLANPSAFDLFVRDWQLAHFPVLTVQNSDLEAGVWGLDADPDSDGLTNGAELLMGTNPLLPDNPRNTRIVADPGGGYALIYQRSKSFPVEYSHPVWSHDLRSWARNGFSETVEADLGSAELIRAVLATGGARAIYMRLEIGAP